MMEFEDTTLDILLQIVTSDYFVCGGVEFHSKTHRIIFWFSKLAQQSKAFLESLNFKMDEPKKSS